MKDNKVEVPEKRAVEEDVAETKDAGDTDECEQEKGNEKQKVRAEEGRGSVG